MNKSAKEIINGIFIGMGTASTVFLIMKFFFLDFAGQRQIKSVLLMGIIVGATTIIYTSERLNLFIQVLIHLSISYTTFLFASSYGAWFPFKEGIVSATLIFILIFIVLWTFFYLREKKELEEVNLKLKERNK